MSFTLTSQSVIRFESSTSRLGDEWQRTLMFFNVDISGGVHCDHRNEITAPRSQERNEKRELINEISRASTDSYSNTFPWRNPGGGLSNSIRECTMPNGKPNEFYAHSRDDFGHRGSNRRQRSLFDRRKNSSFGLSRRPLQYRSTNERWNHADAARFSHCPTKGSTHRYVTTDYETANGYEEGYNNRCALNSYQNEECQLPDQISRDLNYPKKPPDSRDCYDAECYTDSSFEGPADYYTYQRPKRGSYHRSYEIPLDRDCSPYFPEEELSCNDFKDCDCEDRYGDSQHPSEFGRKVRYSPLNCSGYEDYGEKGFRKPSSQPKAKIRNECRKSYKAYRDKGVPINEFWNCNTETERIRNVNFPDKPSHLSYDPGNHGIQSKLPKRRLRSRSRELGRCRRNRSRRHSHLEKVPPYGTQLKKAREASAQHHRISKPIISLHENNPKANGTVPCKNPEKIKFNFTVEEIPQPNKKYIQNEVPLSNYHLDIDDEIPRHQRKLVREPSVTFDKMYDNHDRITCQKPSPDKKKLFDFGSEVPYRLWKNAAPPSMIATNEIPYKKKDRPNYLNSDWGNNCYAVPYSSSVAKLKSEQVQKCNGPRESLYDLKNKHPTKSMKQKISGFFKLSKKCSKRSRTGKDNRKILKNQRHDDQYSGKSRPASKVRKSRTRSASQGSKKRSSSGRKQSILIEPSLIKTKRSITRIGTGSHYPTVFRGKSRNENNEEYSTCNFLCADKESTCCSKPYHCDRIYSGNCSLSNDVWNNEPINQSGGSLTASLKTVASKAIISHDSSNVSGSESSCLSIPIEANVKENEFKNVRFTPTPSIGQTSLSTSSTSQNSGTQGITYSKTTRSRDIQPCSKPANISKSASSEFGFNYRRRGIYPNWTFTHKTCSCHQAKSHKLDCKSCRLARVGLCLPNNIEMISRPPTVIPFESSKKSSLKRPKLERPSNRRVCLQFSSSNSSQSNSISGKSTTNSDEISYRSGKGITTSDQSSCSSEENIPIPVCRPTRRIEKPKCQKSQYNIGSSNDKSSRKKTNSDVISLWSKTKKVFDNIENSNCKTTQCNMGNLCEDRKIKSKLGTSSSVNSSKIIDTNPDSFEKTSKMCVLKSCCNAKEEVDNMEGKPKSQTIINNLGREHKSESLLRSCSYPRENPSFHPRPTVSCCLPKFPSSCSTSSVCFGNLSQKNLKCGPENMQLVCLPNCTCSPCFSSSNSEITKILSPQPCDDSPESISGGDLASNWIKKSTCGTSIVEELKRELLKTFRNNRDIQYQRPGYQTAPHIMIFPCQTPINSNQFFGPDSVVCWAACSKPASPF